MHLVAAGARAAHAPRFLAEYCRAFADKNGAAHLAIRCDNSARGEDSAVVWVFDYADVERLTVGDHRRVNADCAAAVGVNPLFPFNDSLRRRARAALGDMAIVEFPPLPAPPDETLPAVARLFDCLRIKRHRPAENETPAAEKDTPAEKDMPAASDNAPALFMPADLLALAAACGVPARALYDETRAALPPLENFPPFAGGGEDAHRRALALAADAADEARRVLGWLVLLSQCDERRRRGAAPAYDALLRYTPAGEAFARLKKALAVLAAEAAGDAAALRRLRAAHGNGGACGYNRLYSALLLRALLTADGAAAERGAWVGDLRRVTARLSPAQTAAVGAQTFAAVGDAWRNMKDLFYDNNDNGN